jgi:hypothetical protein
MECIHVLCGGGALMGMVMNFRGPQKAGDF